MKQILSFPLAALCSTLFLSGCSDPAADVQSATTQEARTVAGNTGGGSARTFVIQPDSTIGFVGSKVTGSHTGGFTNFSGTIDVEGGVIVGTPKIEIQMDSTWSDNDRLTGHLKSADFFEVETYPVSTFTITSIDASGSQAQVTGNLDLHGEVKSISFPANIQITDDQVAVQAEFSINRKDFNINYPGRPNDLIRDGVVLKLDIKAAPEA